MVLFALAFLVICLCPTFALPLPCIGFAFAQPSSCLCFAFVSAFYSISFILALPLLCFCSVVDLLLYFRYKCINFHLVRLTLRPLALRFALALYLCCTCFTQFCVSKAFGYFTFPLIYFCGALALYIVCFCFALSFLLRCRYSAFVLSLLSLLFCFCCCLCLTLALSLFYIRFAYTFLQVYSMFFPL